jgi:hypothetical protein
MRRIGHLSLTLFLILSPRASLAAVFERDWKTPGDGLLTYDDVHQREWLDLPETQLFKFRGDTLEERYQTVLKETMSGGTLVGFIPATRNDIAALAESSGIDTMTTEFGKNSLATGILIDLLGVTATSVDGINRHSVGFRIDQDRSRFATEVVFGPAGRTDAFAGIAETSFKDSRTGAWLYRSVPEPCTIILVSLSLAAVLGTRFRRNR